MKYIELYKKLGDVYRMKNEEITNHIEKLKNSDNPEKDEISQLYSLAGTVGKSRGPMFRNEKLINYLEKGKNLKSSRYLRGDIIEKFTAKYADVYTEYQKIYDSLNDEDEQRSLALYTELNLDLKSEYDFQLLLKPQNHTEFVERQLKLNALRDLHQKYKDVYLEMFPNGWSFPIIHGEADFDLSEPEYIEEVFKTPEVIPVTENFDAVEFFKCFSDRSRVDIINLLKSNGSGYAELIAKQLSLTSATVCFHLKKLEAAGIVKSEREQFYVMYSLSGNFMNMTIDDILSLGGGSEAEKSAEREKIKYENDVVKNFVKNGKLINLPAQKKKREIILNYIAEKFTPNRDYTEKEVNLIISELYDDFCTVRREMVVLGIMTRNRDLIYRRD